MPRRPRVVLPGVPLHVVHRGNNRNPCFFSDRDYFVYLKWLREYAVQTECSVHAYVLMTNHVHLLLSGASSEGPGALMKAVGQRYVQYVNRNYERSGTLWEGRFRSCVAQDERYLLVCQRYIELNPVRAGMVSHPRNYKWSSYRINAEGHPSDWIRPHYMYAGLGGTDASRQAAYRSLFQTDLDTKTVNAIRNATNKNLVL
ncbi:transposase [Parapusillimonas sp. JC17]|uniref:transposase n=1 Tax=Parapusillimonas sp. JC17 TaxID=3445768 RepID=UPI003FA11B47